MLGIFSKKAPVQNTAVNSVTPHVASSPQNAGLRNALLNFINRDDDGKLLKLRLGSQARISHSNVQDIVNAFDDLVKTGEVSKAELPQVTKALVKLFESPELAKAIQVKIKEDTQMAANNIREAGEILAKLNPEPADKATLRFKQPSPQATNRAA